MNNHVPTKGKKRVCEQCGNEYVDKYYNQTKYCSRECVDKSWSGSSFASSGTCQSIHQWLRYHHGTADRCENRESNVLDFECRNNSEKYDWALKSDCEHDYDKEDYYQLCRSCHRRYDMTEEELKRLRTQTEGRTLSEEHKRKISEAEKGREFSEETKKKISEANSKTVVQYDKNGNKLSEYMSVKEAAEAVDGWTSAISSACNGDYKTSQGYIWNYKN